MEDDEKPLLLGVDGLEGATAEGLDDDEKPPPEGFELDEKPPPEEREDDDEDDLDDDDELPFAKDGTELNSIAKLIRVTMSFLVCFIVILSLKLADHREFNPYFN